MNGSQLRSHRLPGGDIVSALLNREVMILADRGGASNLIGSRWADLAAAHVATWAHSGRVIHTNGAGRAPIVRVERLDATPRIATAASKRGLQNPDLLLIGQLGERSLVQAADAKFSVETARAKQVSPEVVLGLLGLREAIPELLADLDDDLQIEPGLFLCPDFPMTHLMLRRRHGIVRTTVKEDEVELIPAPADRFWHGVEGAALIDELERIDDLPVRAGESLMAGVYYFRLGRAAIGFRLDATKPLLLHNDIVIVDESAVEEEIRHRAASARSAFDLIRRWDADVEVIRNQRAAVNQAAGLPIPGRDLRPLTARIAERAGAEPPSSAQVKRRLAAWYRGELRARVGSVPPPVKNLSAVLRQISAVGRELAPEAIPQLERIVFELIGESKGRDAEPVAAMTNGEVGKSWTSRAVEGGEPALKLAQ
jgi:hypothetical protein